MHTATDKRAPVLCKLKMLACRMRQIFRIGKAKRAYNQKYSANHNNNNNCESENNNNINSELCNLTAQLTNEMAQNAANEWLLQHAAATLLQTADIYADDTESHVICLQTEAGQFYWNAAQTLATELYTCSANDWQ